MKRLPMSWLVAAVIGLVGTGVPGTAAQIDRAPVVSAREVVRIGQDYTLPSGNAVREVVVIFGDASIAGNVYGDMVVVFGTAQLSSTATIDGNLVVVGGSGVVLPGAQLYGDLVVVGGMFDAPAEFSPGGGYVVIDPRALGGRLEGVVPWVTRGLLWGRLIVPDLRWVWFGVGFVFLVALAINFVFDRPIRACAETMVQKPLSASVVGLLVLLLAGPICLLLIVSVIGIAVVPFVVCALLLAWIVGKVSTARAIGMTVMRETSRGNQMQALRSFVIGFAVICVAYIVPVLGLAAWAMTGVVGLGAATLAVIAAYRSENAAQEPAVPLLAMTPARYPGGEAPPPGPAASTYTPPAATVPPGEKGFGPISGSPVAVAPSDLLSLPRAGFLNRLMAFVLDVILVAIARELLELDSRGTTIFLLLLTYHIGFWTWKGTTIGGIICQLRVVRVDGTPLRFVDALVRGLSSIFSLAVLGLGCLWILKDPERQAWHDKIAGTYVVKVPAGWPL